MDRRELPADPSSVMLINCVKKSSAVSVRESIELDSLAARVSEAALDAAADSVVAVARVWSSSVVVCLVFEVKAQADDNTEPTP